MTDVSTIALHTLDGVHERRGLHTLASELREPGVHLLLISGDSELPLDVSALAMTIRDAAVATCAVGEVTGSAVTAYAAGRLRMAFAGATLAWGPAAVVPGLAAVLASASDAAASRLSWGEVLRAEDSSSGLVHRIVDELDSAREAIAVGLTQSGGYDALALRLRAATAAREANSWTASFAFDRYLAAAADPA